MGLDEFSVSGAVFSVIAFFIGIIVSNSMGSGTIMKVIAGVICGIAGYIMGAIIADE